MSSSEISVLAAIQQEYYRAVKIHKHFASPHEGYAVILEELDELKALVWGKERSPQVFKEMQKEAIQIAAMGMRFAVECALKEQ